MPIDSLSSLISVLARGAIDDIIGTAENVWLDFKQVPHDLNKDEGKLEFAKDATAFANAMGGVILVGVTTEKDPGTSADVAASWKRIPKSCVDFDKMRQSVEARTYPPLRTLSFRWWMEEGDGAVLTIEIPQATETEHPILVSKVREEGIKRELLMGLFLRTGDRVVATLPAQIHSQLQMGRQLQRFGILQLPQSSNEQGRVASAAQLEADTRDVELVGKRRLHLQAWPATSALLQRFHGTAQDSLRRAMSEPDCIRQDGFAFHRWAQLELIQSGGLRARDSRYGLSVLRTGLTTCVASADANYLAWADKTRRPLSLNPLALVETVFEFVRFFLLQVMPRTEPRAQAWFLDGGMHDLAENGNRTTLPPGKLVALPLYIGDLPAAPDDNFNLGPIRFDATDTAGRATYQLLRELYAHFGLPEQEIPYATNEAIDENAIKAGWPV